MLCMMLNSSTLSLYTKKYTGTSAAPSRMKVTSITLDRRVVDIRMLYYMDHIYFLKK